VAQGNRNKHRKFKQMTSEKFREEGHCVTKGNEVKNKSEGAEIRW
jgi:hypothetical protein